MSRRHELLSIILTTTMLAGCDPSTAPTNRATETAPSVAAGGICGGIGGTTCSGQGNFCKKPIGQCDAPDTLGVCTSPPSECPYIHDPVCGCDGKTYGNECVAEHAGVNVRAKGKCPEQPSQGVPLPAVQIVPEIRAGGVRDYCRLADRPGGRDLVVRLRNPTPLGKPALNMSVGFTGTPPSTAQATSPAIPPGSTVDVRVPLPNSCFSPDCRFIIKVQDPSGGVQAEGSCIG